MFSKMISILPILATLISSTTAIPLQTREVQAANVGVATLVSYFVANTCDSPFNRAYQTISNGTCMSLGQQATTRSLQLLGWVATEPSCMLRVFNDGGCGEGDEAKMMTVPVRGGNSTCVGTQQTQSIGRLGSAMLVC